MSEVSDFVQYVGGRGVRREDPPHFSRSDVRASDDGGLVGVGRRQISCCSNSTEDFEELDLSSETVCVGGVTRANAMCFLIVHYWCGKTKKSSEAIAVSYMTCALRDSA